MNSRNGWLMVCDGAKRAPSSQNSNLCPRRRRKNLFPLSAALLLIFLAASCGRKDFRSPYQGGLFTDPVEDYRVASFQELKETLTYRTLPQEAFITKAGVTIYQGTSREKNWFTAKVAYQKPDKIRLQGERIPIGTIFTVVIQNGEACLYFNREGNLFVGSLTELQQKVESIGGMLPADMVSAVLVDQGLLHWLNRDDVDWAVIENPEHLLLATRDPASGSQFFWLVRRQDALVEEILVRSAENTPLLRVHYNGYRLEETGPLNTEVPYPSRFRLEAPQQESEVQVDIDSYDLSPTLHPATFRCPEAQRTYPLSRLAFEEEP